MSEPLVGARRITARATPIPQSRVQFPAPRLLHSVRPRIAEKGHLVPEQTVLVLGGGMAGITAARECRKLLAGHRVLVIDRSPRASHPPSFAALAVGEVKGRSILRTRARLARMGIEVVSAEIQSIDLERRQVRAESRELRYDH